MAECQGRKNKLSPSNEGDTAILGNVSGAALEHKGVVWAWNSRRSAGWRAMGRAFVLGGPVDCSLEAHLDLLGPMSTGAIGTLGIRHGADWPGLGHRWSEPLGCRRERTRPSWSARVRFGRLSHSTATQGRPLCSLSCRHRHQSDQRDQRDQRDQSDQPGYGGPLAFWKPVQRPIAWGSLGLGYRNGPVAGAWALDSLRVHCPVLPPRSSTRRWHPRSPHHKRGASPRPGSTLRNRFDREYSSRPRRQAQQHTATPPALFSQFG